MKDKLTLIIAIISMLVLCVLEHAAIPIIIANVLLYALCYLEGSINGDD